MDATSHKCLLVVVAKAPVPGEVKTRFLPQLTPAEAAGLYQCFLQDRLTEIRKLAGIHLAIAYTPEKAKNTFAALTSNRIDLFVQQGQNLGERLNNIFLEKLNGDYQAVSIIDSDSPDLPGHLIEESFQRLTSNSTDVVFGPCHDGGYYLVGMRRPHPELFEDIPWSTDRALSASLDKARRMDLKTHLLGEWHDLDTFEDLQHFYSKHSNQSQQSAWAGEKTLAFLVEKGIFNRSSMTRQKSSVRYSGSSS